MTDDASQAPKDLIGFFDFYLVKKAPFQIPDAGREWIVKYGPWITLVLLVISLPAILVLLGFSVVAVPVAAVSYGWGFGYWPSVLGVIGCVVLEAMALPGLFARKMSGWTLMFYAQAVSVIGSLLAMNILGALVFGLISFYILFQVRPLYKN